MNFKLSTPNQIRGDQLADEIKKATGLDVSNRYSFITPDIVEIVGDLQGKEKTIAAVVAAHIPQAEYFQAEKDLKALRQAITQAAHKATGKVVTDASFSMDDRNAIQNAVWLKMGVIDEKGRVRPLEQWLK